jgi:hypothetical protein
VLQTKAIEKIKTNVLFSVIFFSESCVIYENVQKYRAIQAVDDNAWYMAHSLCMLDN